MDKGKSSSEQIYKTSVVIWFAILMSQVMFLVIVFVVKPELFRFDLGAPILGSNAEFVIAAVAVATVSLTASSALKKKFLALSVAEQKPSFFLIATIISVALAEVSSIIGVVLAFIFDYQFFFVFSALGIIGTLLHFPKRVDAHAASFKVKP